MPPQQQGIAILLRLLLVPLCLSVARFSVLPAQAPSGSRSEVAMAAAIQSMIGQMPQVQAGRAALCLADYRPRGTREVAPALYQRVANELRGSRVRLALLGECPRTYQTMVTMVDSLGRPIDDRPAGAVDPVYLILERPVVTSSGAVLVRVHRSQGTQTDFFVCDRNECARLGSSRLS